MRMVFTTVWQALAMIEFSVCPAKTEHFCGIFLLLMMFVVSLPSAMLTMTEKVIVLPGHQIIMHIVYPGAMDQNCGKEILAPAPMSGLLPPFPI